MSPPQQGGGGRGGGGGGGGGGGTVVRGIPGQKGPEPSKTLQFRDFSDGLVRAGSRSGIPDSALWESTNVQVIGPGQMQTLAGPAASIVTLVGIAAMWGVLYNPGGPTQPEVSRLITIHADGSIREVNPDTGANTVICAAGTMSAATRLTVWRDTHLLFIDPTKGYGSWDGTTFIVYPSTFAASTTSGSSVITWTGGPIPNASVVSGMALSGAGIPAGSTVVSVAGASITMTANATATASITVTVGAGSPTSGRDIGVFEGRVWLVTGNRGLTFTGPGSFTSFQTVYAGGTTTMPDAIFPGQISRIVSAIQLLWIFGPGAINNLSNVQVNAGATTFQNENLVAGVGSALTDSVQPLFRTILFFSPPGVYAILGATPQKLSDNLDTLMPSVTAVGTGPAAVFTLNRIAVYAILVDVAGVRRILVYSRPTWLLADQNDLGTVTWICSLLRTNGDTQGWATDGTHIFRLFAGAAATYGLRLKQFDFGAFTRRDTIRRVAIEADIVASTAPGLSPDLQLEVENESTTASVAATFNVGDLSWINSGGTVLGWQNNAAAPASFSADGHVVLSGAPQFSGNLLSLHLFGQQSVPMIISAVALEIGVGGEWTFA